MKLTILRNCCVVVALACVNLLNEAHAQTPKIDDPNAKLDQIEQSLKDSSDRQAALAADIDAALQAQTEISDKLIALSKTLDGQQAAAQAADTKLQKLTSEAVVIRSSLAERQDQLSELLAGLQRLEQNPPPALVVEPKNILEALRGAMMFGAVVPDMRSKAVELQTQLQRLEAIKSETEAAKKTQSTTLIALKASQTELVQLQAEKKSYAATSSKNLAAEKLRAADLATEAKNLKQLLAALEEDKKRAEAIKTAEVKAREEAEKQKRLSLAKPAMIFTQSRGKLNYPVQGDILKQFGEDNGLGGTLDGVAVASTAQANVSSPVDGRVEFAGPFRSYGQLLILDVGEGYLVLLAGMKQISAEIGQSVRAGEPLGVMGEGPSSVALIGNETNNAHPVLYVEFRKNNNPVDPSPWWIGGRKEAMK